MPLVYDSETKTFTIHTDRSTYQMQVDRFGYLLHLYYGSRTEGTMDYLITYADRSGMCGSPHDVADRTYSLDVLPQEYPFQGTGDMRCPLFEVRDAEGAWGCDLRYVRHELREGKYGLPGLPAAYAGEGDDAKTLSITLGDPRLGLEVELLYGVLPKIDIITRAAIIKNEGNARLTVERAETACLDFIHGNYDVMSFNGRHAMERRPDRHPVGNGSFSVGSRRGMSSNQYSPAMILLDHDATETHGRCWSMTFVYSGNFKGQAERDQYDQTRVILGLQDELFSYRLAPGEDAYTRRFEQAGITAEPSPEGTHVYGYNASLAHRRGDWLVTVAGHSRYVWSAEIYQGANHYGRYLTHGSVQLLGDGDPVSAFGSGFRQEGWDWCHIPGTTALAIPMERLKADIRNVDTFSGYEEMLLSDEAFAGGVSLGGRNGLFAMRLHDHDKYNGTLRAQKSVFLFDNRIVCLGSEIENAAEGGVHTTLFQNFLERESDPVVVDGTEVTAFPYEAELTKGAVLRDNLRNLYIIPRGRVHVARSLQHSLHEETDAPTENNFATAWIDHGDGEVSGGDYEYLMVVHATDDEAARYARRLPYEVVRCDAAAHIVRDIPTGIEAYALFRGGEVGEGRLVEVSLPSLVMIDERKDALTVAVADPDLRYYEGPSDEKFNADGKRIERSIYSRSWIDNPSIASEVRVTLRGRWQAEGDTDGVRVETGRKNTVLTFTCREGATREVRLIEKR